MSRLVVLIGDFNIGAEPPRHGLDHPGLRLAGSQGWASHSGGPWQRLFRELLELQVPDPTHCNSSQHILAYIDRAF
eukprot:5131848-Pyramimonas_sp.AAC.1